MEGIISHLTRCGKLRRIICARRRRVGAVKETKFLRLQQHWQSDKAWALRVLAPLGGREGLASWPHEDTVTPLRPGQRALTEQVRRDNLLVVRGVTVSPGLPLSSISG